MYYFFDLDNNVSSQLAYMSLAVLLLSALNRLFLWFTCHVHRTEPYTPPVDALRVSDFSAAEDRTMSKDTETVPQIPKTGSNVLKFSLRTLSSISCNIPFGQVLSSVIDPLLEITARIEQTSANEKGLVEMAARIDLLSPIVSKKTTNEPGEAQGFVSALQRELQSIAEDLDDARSRGKLEQFFNSDANASRLAQHNQSLAQIIADATFDTVQHVSQSLDTLEGLLSAKSDKAENSRTDLHGGIGGKGGYGAQTGGEGGLGEAAQLAIEHSSHFRRISGGTGGEGGAGDIIGGKGGTGQGPRFGSLLTSVDGNDLPALTVAEFCQKYNLSERIFKLLDDQGFEMAGALFKLNTIDLEKAGFKLGHIAELKRALDCASAKK